MTGRRALGIGLWVAISLVFAETLEARMWTHALVQLPLLGVSGYWLAPRSTPAHADRFALSALLVAVFAGAIWMLPRMLDAALAEPTARALKLTSIPLLIGVPLGWSWPRLSGLVRAFVGANLISMLLTLGWLYKAAPVRVCNYYVLSEQDQVGTAYLVLAALLVAGGLPRFFSTPPREASPTRFGNDGSGFARGAVPSIALSDRLSPRTNPKV